MCAIARIFNLNGQLVSPIELRKLTASIEWEPDCVERFNGMFAFAGKGSLHKEQDVNS